MTDYAVAPAGSTRPPRSATTRAASGHGRSSNALRNSIAACCTSPNACRSTKVYWSATLCGACAATLIGAADNETIIAEKDRCVRSCYDFPPKTTEAAVPEAQIVTYRGFQITANITDLLGGPVIVEVQIATDDLNIIAKLKTAGFLSFKKWHSQKDLALLDAAINGAKQEIDQYLGSVNDL
jgi:hypothetical protein